MHTFLAPVDSQAAILIGVAPRFSCYAGFRLDQAIFPSKRENLSSLLAAVPVHHLRSGCSVGLARYVRPPTGEQQNDDPVATAQ